VISTACLATSSFYGRQTWRLYLILPLTGHRVSCTRIGNQLVPVPIIQSTGTRPLVCVHPPTMNPEANKFADRSYRPEWLSIPHNHQSANPPHRESLYLQEEHSKFGKEDRGNGHFPPQAALINSHPVPSREASLGPLPFVNWHSTYVFMGTDLDVTGDPSASPKCVTGRKMGWPTRCRDPIVSVPFQTQSRHDGSASPIPPEGSRDVFAGYFEKDPIISDEYPKQEPDYNATRTSPLEQDNPDDESLVKKRVSSLRVRTTSRARRKVEARFICPISRCGGTFTRKKNLECE